MHRHSVAANHFTWLHTNVQEATAGTINAAPSAQNSQIVPGLWRAGCRGFCKCLIPAGTAAVSVLTQSDSGTLLAH